MNKPVQIVMPMHNRWKMTEQSIKSLFANTPHNLFKFYVINDGSDPNDRENLLSLLRSLPSDMWLYFENKEAMSPGLSRNWVCKQITKHDERGVFLYHSDNDVYFKEGWLDKLMYATYQLEKQGVLLIGGGCHPYLQDNRVINIPQAQVGIKDAVSGYSQMMKWQTWDEFGPFDETMRDAAVKIMGSEDWAFCQKIVKAGKYVGALEPEVVIHCGKTNTYGNPATGNETFKEVPGIVIE